MAGPSGEVVTPPPASAPTGVACPFAHSRNASGERHSLVDHLTATAELAGEFGAPFGAAADCYTAGLWHDIGKVDPAFQDYLEAREQGRPHQRVDHKTAGALLAAGSPTTWHLAQIILGHHGGMPDRGPAGTLLVERAQDQRMLDAARWAETALPHPPVPGSVGDVRGAALDVRLRLIFSAVVDADFLDTEKHFDVDRGHARQVVVSEGMERLADRELDAHSRFLSGRQSGGAVDAVRADIRDAALRASRQAPGLFRLTVPTGGGKTRAALAFALQHAVHHGLRRVVTAVPFITVTDQTAQVYRDVLGRSSVLEHHSGIEAERHDADARGRLWCRLAAENWDAPIVVTTTVQLFESLFANRPSALRKAHRLARSVVILDEAQVLRLAVLGVTIDMLAALTRVAGSTIVLCTATQPAIEQIAELAEGEVREIVPDYEQHFSALRRVSFAVPARQERWSWTRVAAEACGARQALAILNRRRDALSLLAEMPPDTFHLSTLLCGAHRRRVLAEVREALANDRDCRLVATQVVEAGVDLDFPLVLRALGPFDSVVQAAGRCNREGRLESGRCIVFRPEETDSFGEYRRGQATMIAMLTDGEVDFASPSACQRYFRDLYGTGSEARAMADRGNLRAAVEDLRFASVASAYRLIDDITKPVIVLYPPARRRIDRLLAQIGLATEPGRARMIMRRLQPYVISLRERDLERALSRGLLAERSGMAVWTAPYDMRVGVGALLSA
jgi:CRISPR-associated endonuclease/helicase Cas3